MSNQKYISMLSKIYIDKDITISIDSIENQPWNFREASKVRACKKKKIVKYVKT